MIHDKSAGAPELVGDCRGWNYLIFESAFGELMRQYSVRVDDGDSDFHE